ncbi:MULTISPECIES: hypothetical protein [unclassified Bradyrhizobium]|uniref:hypothetical protein n=1 Tax=unclassified Bradyrhizobium TaxID=2631580 RepID=UPI001BAD9A31|nr:MULTISPECIES: hypothetical protein [unclassified Bradyrhizobium]MBR1208770.1 hypothetical protein [Bradyrhizobium sp. AUGA SZCCT0124]MBR1316963.1 hypothetical protein [Bradyrhizobium sp. AUGA SZCCT0051]MBR1345241.1 hypothetical protein [Bradyrhizobium sp. AUGA SZCCT0105]MBR1360057.1 hypothetical protein [Bradyrhizobium sp. AUGA SZCCT0045]
MSDLDLNKRNTAQKPDTPLSERLKDQMQDAGAEMKERAGDALRASTDTAREKFAEAAEATKGVASGTMDQFQDRARDKQQSGADFIQRFAGNIREAARAFESDSPFAAKGISSAADYVEGAGEKIRDGSFRDLVDNATGFAKRQPAAFLGLSVLAGFAAVRFLRAADGGSSSQGSDGSAASKNDEVRSGGSSRG